MITRVQPVHDLLKAADQIRHLLLREFPESQNLQHQCKRAAILLDLYSRRHGIPSYPTAGFITKDSDANDPSRGHVWTMVPYRDRPYALDITLTQFERYLGFSIPPVLFMPWSAAQRTFGYRPDGGGVYRYDPGDVRASLVDQLDCIPFGGTPLSH